MFDWVSLAYWHVTNDSASSNVTWCGLQLEKSPQKIHTARNRWWHGTTIEKGNEINDRKMMELHVFSTQTFDEAENRMTVAAAACTSPRSASFTTLMSPRFMCCWRPPARPVGLRWSEVSTATHYYNGGWYPPGSAACLTHISPDSEPILSKMTLGKRVWKSLGSFAVRPKAVYFGSYRHVHHAGFFMLLYSNYHPTWRRLLAARNVKLTFFQRS